MAHCLLRCIDNNFEKIHNYRRCKYFGRMTNDKVLSRTHIPPVHTHLCVVAALQKEPQLATPSQTDSASDLLLHLKAATVSY